MAQANYQRSAQRKGFQPLNMSNNAPQQIINEGNRVAQGMRTQRDAIFNDRQNLSQAMATNYDIESSARDRNFERLMGNLQIEQQETQDKIQKQGAQQAKLFETIGSLSQTAAKAVIDFEQSRKETQKQTDIKEFLTNPTYRKALMDKHNAAVLEGNEALARGNSTVVAAEAAGADPADASRALDVFEGFSPGQKIAILNEKARGFAAYLEGELSGDRQFTDPSTGTNFTGAEAAVDGRLRAIAAQQVLDTWLQTNGFNKLSMEFLAPALEIARKTISTDVNRALTNQVNAQNARVLSEFPRELYNNDSNTAVSSLLANKSKLLRAFNYDNTKLNKWIYGLVYKRDSNNNYLMDSETRELILATKWGPNGETLGSYKGLRADAERQARIDRINIAREDRASKALDGQQLWEEMAPGMEEVFAKGNPAEDIQAFNTFEAQYEENFGPEVPLPAGYLKRKKEVLNDNKQEEAQLVEDSANGTGAPMTRERAMQIVDPEVRKAALKLVTNQEAEIYGGSYEDLNKSLKGFAKELTGLDITSQGISPMGTLLLPILQQDYNNLYRTELANRTQNGVLAESPEVRAAARQAALQQLQQMVTEGKNNPVNPNNPNPKSNKYSRRGDAPNNVYEFPNLGLEEQARAARGREAQALAAYSNSGASSFDVERTIFTDNQILSIAETYRKTGVLNLPSYIYKISRMSGVLPIEIFNRQLKASGLDVDPITPPSSYKELQGKDPEVVELFHEGSRRQQERALTSVGMSDIDAASDPARYVLNTIAGVESSGHGHYDAYNLGGSNRGHTAHGSGNSAKDLRFGKPISQLTIGEIKQLHRQGKLWATGRYQFVAGTFKEVAALTGLPDNTVFSPDVQDQFALTRLKQRLSWGGDRATALGTEWIGLQYLSKAEMDILLQAVSKIVP